MFTSEAPVHSKVEVSNHSKVLFFPRATNKHRELLEVFSRNGWVVDSVCQKVNFGEYPGELGPIGVGVNSKLKAVKDRANILAELVGIDSPREVNIFTSQVALPVVVKNVIGHRGGGIHFIDTEEKLTYIRTIFNNRYMHAMEFIECPSDYFTSFRFLVDTYGRIHSSLLMVSEKRKQESANGHIMSNISQGGSDIQLNGRKIRDKSKRAVLLAHGIDPNDPRPTDELLTVARNIGRECRGLDLWFGLDFMMRNADLSLVLLEANRNPRIQLRDIGLRSRKRLSKNQAHRLAELEMLRRVASYDGGS